MEKDQIIILEDRGLIAVEGADAKDFLQNIISNNIERVNKTNSIFSGIFLHNSWNIEASILLIFKLQLTPRIRIVAGLNA